MFESVECSVSLVTPVPMCALAGKANKRNNNVGIVEYNALIKVCEPQEGLKLLDGLRSGPVQDSINLGLGHREAGRRDYEAEELCRFDRELAFFGVCIKFTFLKARKNLADFCDVFIGIGEDENLVQIDEYRFVEEVGKIDGHKMLEGSGSISEAKMHDLEIGGSAEVGGFHFITGSKSNDVGGSKIDFSIDVGGMETVKKVGNGRRWKRTRLRLFERYGLGRVLNRVLGTASLC